MPIIHYYNIIIKEKLYKKRIIFYLSLHLLKVYLTFSPLLPKTNHSILKFGLSVVNFVDCFQMGFDGTKFEVCYSSSQI